MVFLLKMIVYNMLIFTYKEQKNMNDYDLTERLYSICGPVLRYRIATELMDNVKVDIKDHQKDLLNQDVVQDNIKYYAFGAEQAKRGAYFYTKIRSKPELLETISSNMIHGSNRELLENAVPKLWSFGIKRGFDEIDKYLEIYIKIMEYDYNRKGVMRIGYGKNAIAQFLSLLGYANEQSVFRIMKTRLDQVYAFVLKERYDIYVNAEDYSGIPSNWKDEDKIIDPELTTYSDEEGEPPLPFIYDILGFIGMKQAGLSEDNERKINAVLKYCLDERYQKSIMPGYGILLAPTGRFYGCGWSIHLPGFGQELNENVDINKLHINQLLLRLELLSNFPIIKDLPHMAELFDFFERYRDDDGFYCFPKEFIPEKNSGYFVLGPRMGLTENRKKKDGYIAESTFRVLKMKKNLALYK